ncbi:MAG: radical SAM protein, partial [Oscillospiraceae bacterium]
MRVRFFSLGCRVNQVDAQALRGLFAREGFEPVEQGDAEVLVVNSCTVTSMADRKTRQLVRRLRREQPAAVLVLTGCLPQASPEAAALLTEADLVTGAREQEQLPARVREWLKTGRRVVSIPDFEPKTPFEGEPAERFDDSFQRAYLKIEDGCDRYCAYCVIPRARGPVRSRPPNEVAAETARLAAAGYRELVLTGINLSRYGAGEGLRLTDAVRAACEIPGDFRVRLGSVEPVLLGEADYQALSGLERLCPQFHLSLQSGCDDTLARMNRRYTTAEYLNTVRIIRSLFNNPSITTDLIV